MKCPACNNERVIKGRYLDQIGGGLSQVFRPGGLKLLTLIGSDLRVSNGDRFYACLDCGLLWSSIDNRKLVRIIEKHGNIKTKQRLGLAF
jgi:DNA-directed RNA polymerase subunit RPC12/RpoP